MSSQSSCIYDSIKVASFWLHRRSEKTETRADMKSTNNSSRNLAKILPQLSIGLAVTLIPLLLAIALKMRAASSEQIQSAGTLTTPRVNHTATVLSDGRVLIAGGISTNGVSATAEIFDPATKEFTAVGNMSIQ